jgi:hypothetical protein
MEYLALLVPVMTLAGLPLLDRLERWAVTADGMAPPARPPETGSSTPTSSGDLG